mmetsp:Transcript_159697/g.291443  ORF Transcript_159697/g.291443 Transcript_159697/m.291443 type:complete len:226 (+) Transcript_159697:46-723(+)
MGQGCCSLEKKTQSDMVQISKDFSHLFGGKEPEKPPSAQQEITWYQEDLKAKFRMRKGLKIAFDDMGGKDGKIYEDEFFKFCTEEINYEGDVHLLYRIINFHGNNGYIDKGEFMMSIQPDFLKRAVMHDFREWVHLNFDLVDECFNCIDTDHSRSISKQEFVSALGKIKFHQDPEMLYYVLDKNQNETVTITEMKYYLAFADPDTKKSRAHHSKLHGTKRHHHHK